MKKYLILLIFISDIACLAQKSAFQKHVVIDVSTYEYENKTRASAMPEITTKSKLKKYRKRFDYLLRNIPEIYLPEKTEERNAIFNLYPDKSKIKKLYLEKLIQDKKLVAYFEETIAPINDPDLEINKAYALDELMEVASKFFYCDKVNPDTTVQSHVCIGINGMKEARWEKDYTILAAFCYEAIFNDLEDDESKIRPAYISEKKQSCEEFRKNITTLDKYLEDVKLDFFNRMKNNATLKEELLAYYELHKTNLAFRITK